MSTHSLLIKKMSTHSIMTETALGWSCMCSLSKWNRDRYFSSHISYEGHILAPHIKSLVSFLVSRTCLSCVFLHRFQRKERYIQLMKEMLRTGMVQQPSMSNSISLVFLLVFWSFCNLSFSFWVGGRLGMLKSASSPKMVHHQSH